MLKYVYEYLMLLMAHVTLLGRNTVGTKVDVLCHSVRYNLYG
jgi:hypothetical protein